jgi:gluconokinase
MITKIAVLALDVGTSGVRAALFDNESNEVVSVRVGRDASLLSDFTELDPDKLVDEVIQAIDKLFSEASDIEGIEAIAISAFWHSLLGIDSKGLPATPVLTWADTRATRFAKTLRNDFNEPEIHLRTGCRFHSSYWPAKILWLREEQHDAYEKTDKWIGFAEYLCLQLFGKICVSTSMASATGLMNQRTCYWDWEFLSQLDLPRETLPSIDHNINMTLRSTFVERWPALVNARLITVVGDGAANNIGGGCASKKKIALMVGTSGAMRTVFAGDPPPDLATSIWSYRADQRRVAVGGALSDGGGLYRWLMQSLAVDNEAEFASELARLEPDSHGLTVLPFWSGERSTGWTGDARGAIVGFTQQTKPVEIVRAALEAIAYRFALIAQALDEISPDAQIVATGNALRSSPVWLQIIADVLGRQVVLGGSAEASIRGAALLALEALGKIESIEAVTVSVDRVFEPNMEAHARYRKGLERQEGLYRKLMSGMSDML